MRVQLQTPIAGTADLLEATRIRDIPLGVEKTKGFCEERVPSSTGFGEGDDGSNGLGEFEKVQDVAYRLSSRAVLSVNTAQLFPGKNPLYEIPWNRVYHYSGNSI